MTTPIPTLYVSNVPKSATEEELKKFFEDSLKDDDDKKKSDEVPDPEVREGESYSECGC